MFDTICMFENPFWEFNASLVQDLGSYNWIKCIGKMKVGDIFVDKFGNGFSFVSHFLRHLFISMGPISFYREKVNYTIGVPTYYSIQYTSSNCFCNSDFTKKNVMSQIVQHYGLIF